ncbi:MAG: thymidine phosphorylase [Malacoplasma sp.]|nr:thymidine phosphorylase [Malacoplasma sp.]
MFNILNLIEKKKKNEKISESEFADFIKAVVNKTVADYQITAFLMCIYFNKLDEDETYYLTKAMVYSGKVLKWPQNIVNLVDKHSTGGIGDKVSLILLPLLSALNVNVAKMSGRGLGYTGGTIDKLDSIGFNTSLDFNQAYQILLQNKFFVMQQTNEIVPADKILYSLRDTSGTVNNVSLIVSSIMSKKIATNADIIYLDAKVGECAFFKNLEEAKVFGLLCIKIGQKFNKKVVVHYTDMDKPLGRSLGNLIEVKEAIDFLQNKFDCLYLKELIFEFVKDILIDLKMVQNQDQAYAAINNVLQNQEAIKRFLKWNQLQNGRLTTFDSLQNIYQPKYSKTIFASKSGYLKYKSNQELGLILIDLKAGRKQKGDALDFDAGLYLNKYNGEKVEVGQEIITIYSSSPISQEIVKKVEGNIEIRSEKIQLNKTILGVSK